MPSQGWAQANVTQVALFSFPVNGIYVSWGTSTRFKESAVCVNRHLTKKKVVFTCKLFQQSVPFPKHKRLDIKTNMRECAILTNGSLEMGFKGWCLFSDLTFTLSLCNTLRNPEINPWHSHSFQGWQFNFFPVLSTAVANIIRSYSCEKLLVQEKKLDVHVYFQEDLFMLMSTASLAHENNSHLHNLKY